MNIQISTVGGVEFATLPRAELDEILARLENMSDIHAAGEVVRQVADGEDEFIPAEFAERFISGESPLRVWREIRGLTQMALAGLSGVNRVQIADIESGRRNGSVSTLKKLSDALKIKIDDLV